jgi:ectoine hydroxylase-related dioxygenase (phytanoyl-CoA dioxygenase family)
LQSPYPDVVLGIQVIYALNDFSIENGASIYVPNSHINHCFPKQEFIPENEISFITVSKGSIILYRGDMWLSQGINTTEIPHVALLGNFSPLHIPAKDDVLSQVISSNVDLKVHNGKIYI